MAFRVINVGNVDLSWGRMKSLSKGQNSEREENIKWALTTAIVVTVAVMLWLIIYLHFRL
jgi:hypothetical protein